MSKIKRDNSYRKLPSQKPRNFIFYSDADYSVLIAFLKNIDAK
jgi:hypothetical protein